MTTSEPTGTTAEKPVDDGFVVQAEQFADIRVLRYRVPGFEQLPVAQKKLVYYLYRAGLIGGRRD